MRYIRKDVIVDAFQIVSVGPHAIAIAASLGINAQGGDLTHSVGGSATWECTLENGDKVNLHTGRTGFVPPMVGDYYTADGSFMQKKSFEANYAKEYYGSSDGQDEESSS